MRRRVSVRRSQLLVGLLAVLLVVPLSGPALADDDEVEPEDTTTTLAISPEAPKIGDPVTVTATIAMEISGAAVEHGWVDFDAAATVDTLWDDVSPVEFVETTVANGVAVVEFTIDTATLPFLSEGSEGFFLAAQYIPFDGEVVYEEYNASLSEPSYISLTSTPTTTTVTGPASAVVDLPTSLTVAVTPATAEGTVQFSIGGALVGAPVAVNDGAAALTHTFSAMGVSWVGATFTPADAGMYDASLDSAGLQVTVDPGTSSIEVTGPASATAGEATTLAATVQPADATGTVTFLADGSEVATVALDAGAASTPYTFETAGESTVIATFDPATGSQGPTTSVVHTVAVEEGASAEWWEEPYRGVNVSFGSGCKAASGVTDVGRAAAPNGFDWPGQLPGGTPFNSNIFTFTPLSLVPGFLKPIYGWFTQINFQACIVGLSVVVGPYGRTAKETATVVKGTVQCVPTATGYACPFDFPEFEAIAITGNVPLPVAFGGQQVNVESKLTSTDPTTGETSTSVTHNDLFQVPKRTALTAKLAPTKSNVTSVKRSKSVAYRVQVRNAGVVTAKGVRTCVTVGKGAKVLAAKGANVRGRQACWTVPSLKGGKSLTRTLTLRAPGKSGTLKLVAAVTPKKTQADPVRLTTVLPVK